jgi:hypothetical protein
MHPTGRSPLVTRESVASGWPGLALDGLARREHARRPIKIAIHSLGIALGTAPVHARGRPPSIAVRCGSSPVLAGYVARITQRCSGRALKALRLGALTVF